MSHGARLDTTEPHLVSELHRLLELAGTDERSATAEFHTLVDTYGKREVGAAVAVVTAEYLGGEVAAGGVVV
jgi:hypothetical protein